jgi:hypothetical protein
VETHASWQGPQPRKLFYWCQLVAMVYAQLSGKKSLRDRGYVEFAWLYYLHQQGVGFVTRLLRNVRYQVRQQPAMAADAGGLADHTIRLTTAHSRSRYPDTLRLVHYRDPETGKEYVFLNNRPELPPWRWPTCIGSVGRSKPFSAGSSTIQ